MLLAGNVDEISRSRVAGWAVNLDHPDKPVSVLIFVNGSCAGLCLAADLRQGITLPSGEPAPGHCGFRYEFDPPLSPFIEQQIKVMESSSAQLLPNGGYTVARPIRRAVGETRIPILLTSTGRSGTTLLMSQFVRQSGIIVGDQYPYEIKQIGYHAAAFRALVADADRERSTHPDTMFQANKSRWIGANPYHGAGFFDLASPGTALRRFHERTVPAEYATLFATLIQEFYGILALSRRKQAARFFCEKTPVHDTPRQAARLFFDQVKEIVLVRDPRDLLCSTMAFWKYSPERAMTMLRRMTPRLHQIARDTGNDTLVIRYEDLIHNPVRIRNIMSGFLGLDLFSSLGVEDPAIPDSHRTSASPEASIGRWRHDLTREQIATCEAVCAPFMHDFDYRPQSAARPLAPHFPDPRDAAVGSRLVAEGIWAVRAFLDNTNANTAGGRPSRVMADMTFDSALDWRQLLGEEWSKAAAAFVWTNAGESHVALPAIGRPAHYRIYIAAAPVPRGANLGNYPVDIPYHNI